MKKVKIIFFSYNKEGNNRKHKKERSAAKKWEYARGILTELSDTNVKKNRIKFNDKKAMVQIVILVIHQVAPMAKTSLRQSRIDGHLNINVHQNVTHRLF